MATSSSRPNELNFGTILARDANYDPNNPTNFLSPGAVDPNVKNDRTREFLVGFDRQLGRNMGVGRNYIWRKYNRFLWQDVDGFTIAEARSPSTRPTARQAACGTVTYFVPAFAIPSPFTYTNVPDR